MSRQFEQRRHPMAYDLASHAALGQIPGWTSFRKFGMNPDVDSGREQVWPPGIIQVLPLVGGEGVASIVSDSIADDLGSTGGEKLLVQGIDSSYNLIEESVDMDGTTPVLTILEFYRIYRAYFTQAGTGMENAGNISISIGGALQAYIELLEGQTHITQYTVPADHTLLLYYYAVNSGRIGNFDLAAQFQIRLL